MSQERPNILWIITDDHRADALACYNRATTGKSESALGYVSSPELDKLASEGVLFTQSYCNSPGSAPSRTSMITGMYPHHRGVYGFEYYHEGPDFTPQTLPGYLREAGYQTVGMGKLGVRLKKHLGNGKTQFGYNPYSLFFDTKDHQKHGETDQYAETIWAGEKAGSIANYDYPSGERFSFYTSHKSTGKQTKEDIKKMNEFNKRQDILTAYVGSGILGGVSPQPATHTTDGAINREVKGFLASADKQYAALTRKTVDGPKSDQPLFLYLGFHFPHTPVLPSQSFRDKFKDKVYNAPKFDQEEWSKMPQQMKVWQSKSKANELSAKDQQKFIRDYYAFCAMGDSLLGASVREFKEYCKRNNDEYMILIVCGDHAWHLGEQGSCNKFAPYKQSNHTAVIAISSDKEKFPAGKVVNDFVEHVDFAPSILAAAGFDVSKSEFDHLDGYDLSRVTSGEAIKRDYVLGEINHVCGPHAFIRTDDFVFGMRNRKNGGIPAKDQSTDPNVEMRWALDAPLEDVDPVLHDLRVDPFERNNVALDPQYRELAEYLRKKLATIVLGDGRIEVDWKAANSYKRSTFALGADDKKLEIPASIIPKTKK